MKARTPLLALAAFALLAIVMTWPVLPRLTTELAGGRDDLWVHQWTFWWVKEALLSGQNPYFTNLLYFPQGAALTSHNIAWFNIALWLPLQALFGNIVAHNLIFMAVFALNGWCMFLFARDWLQNDWAAFAAGVVVGFWPYTMSHYDHANMMVIFWVPLVMLHLGRVLRTQRWQNALWAGLFLGLLGITRYQLVVMSAPIVAAFVAYVWLTQRETRTRRSLALVTGAGLLGAVIMLPLALPLLIDQFTRSYPEDTLLDERIFGRTDLAAYLTPSINSGLWAERVASRYANFTVNQFYTPFLGFTSLALAILGSVRRWKRAWIWLALAIFYMLMALGPELAINGVAYPALPMPARLIDDTLFYQVVRRPDRFNIFLSLPFAMLVGLGFEVVLSWSKRRWAIGLAALLGLTLLVETSAVPFATTPLTIPAWEQARTEQAWPAATLDIPINDRSSDKWAMVYQTSHGKPIATGHISRMPRETTDFLDAIPFVAAARANDSVPDLSQNDVGRQLNQLNEAGIEAIVIHKALANEGVQAMWRDWLGFEPRHEDDDVMVFATAPQAGVDFELVVPFSAEIGVAQFGQVPSETVQGGRLILPIRWATMEVPSAEMLACLQLRNDNAVAAEQCQPPDAHPISEWIANDLVRSQVSLPIPADLPPDTYQLTLHLIDANDQTTVGKPAEIQPIDVQPFAPQVEPDLTWDNGIALVGIAAEPGLELTLYWTSAESQASSSKVFVHLVDPSSGEIVAQSDHIPRGWSYPTTDWQPGEIVADRVTLPDVAAGTYQLRIGLTDEASGAPISVAGEHFALPATVSEDGHVAP